MSIASGFRFPRQPEHQQATHDYNKAHNHPHAERGCLVSHDDVKSEGDVGKRKRTSRYEPHEGSVHGLNHVSDVHARRNEDENERDVEIDGTTAVVVVFRVDSPKEAGIAIPYVGKSLIKAQVLLF